MDCCATKCFLDILLSCEVATAMTTAMKIDTMVSGMLSTLMQARDGDGGADLMGILTESELFGAFMALLGLAVTVVVFMKNMFIDMSANLADAEVPMKEIGTALVGSEKYQYVLPFEFISVFLLACIIGGIVISRKE